MAETLTDGLAWMRGQLKANDSRTVTYARGAESQQLSMRPARTAAEQTDQDGGIIRQIEFRDWIVSVADFALFEKPLRGDKVTDGTRTFFVQAVVPGEPPYRLIERDTAYRIHTLEVDLTP